MQVMRNYTKYFVRHWWSRYTFYWSCRGPEWNIYTQIVYNTVITKKTDISCFTL